MDISERNTNNNDLLALARVTKAKLTDLIVNETIKLKSVKVSFGLKVSFNRKER